MSRVVIALFSFLLLVPRGLAADTEIFTNFNSSACSQTGSSQFTLPSTANVTHWGVWYDWSTGQTSVAATVQQGSATVFSGNLARASCDPNQASWCNADAVVNASWPAGAYTVTVNPARMCMNSGSSNQGFVYIYGSTGTGGGTSIIINNPGFETLPSNPVWSDCSGSGGAGCRNTYDGNIPGWSTSGSISGLFQPGPSDFTLPLPAAEGQTVAFTNGGTISQVLSATLQASTLYTLQVDVGRYFSNLYSSPPPTAQLFAGSTPIASATGAQPPLGGWTTWTGTYQSSASDPLAGQTLKIVLGATNPQGDFDNVRLTAAQTGGTACTYSLSASSASVGAAQSTGTVAVTAGTGCTWTATSNAPTWLTTSSAGIGNGTVSYAVTANATTSSRTGTITVGGQTFTVTQAAATSCSYLITPASYNMAAQGGSSSITVTVSGGSSCSWSASVSSNATSWLHLGSTTSGTTNGSVSFTGDANTSMGSRTGTITVANQTFTVTQAGGATTSAPSISAGGIVNALDYRAGGLAQGAFFTIFGSNLGPVVGQGVTAFPFSTNLGGVTVTVTQGSTTKQAYPHYVCATQINAIMPSDAPLGNVQITVAYNGVIGAAAAATVVNNAFGIMAVGSGPGIIQNYNSATDEPINAASKPAKPNQIEIIWGTGLGPISTPDNQPPAGGQLPLPVQVWVGGKQANVQYSGRAPGFPAIDNIYFTVPSDVPLGCYIPVQVNAGGTWSNTSRLAISSDGKACQDTFNPFSGLSSNGGRSGTIGLVRVNFTDQLGQTSETSATVDLGLGAFATNAGSTTTYSPITNLPPPGTCVATNKMLDLSAVMNTGGSSLDPTITAALDAGPQLTVSKPGGATVTITRDTEDEGPTAPYLKALGGVLTPAISDFDMGPLFLDGGPFTVSNGTGGKDVGPFTTTIPLAPAITWTNPPSTINRSSPLTLTWTGGNSTQTILILAGSSDQNSQASGGFTCLAPAAAGTFTVPANALADMIPIGAQTNPASIFGMLSLMPLQSGNMQFTKLPTGLDVGVAFNTTMTVRTVQVK
jgi:uncharacterized protein (TIGR03437 family)